MAQLAMFQGRKCDGPQTAHGPDFHFFRSTTWMYRAALMEDFKVRSACPRLLYRPRRRFPITDEDGVEMDWIVTDIPGGDGGKRHVSGPDGKRMMQPSSQRGKGCKLPDGRWVYGIPAERHEPEHEFFPSYRFGQQDDIHVVADDGATWGLGERGNALEVMLMEAVCHPLLWPKEKVELTAWLRGPRMLVEDVSDESWKDDPLFRIVDGYYHDEIMVRADRFPGLEDEIRRSGMPAEAVENLTYNLRCFVRAVDER